MQKSLHTLCLLLALLCCGAVSAQSGPTTNQPFEATDFQFTAWDNVAIPASYFLSDAVEIQVAIKGAVYVAFQVNDKDYQVFDWNDGNAAGITYTLDNTSRAAALAGTLKVRVDVADATLTILNKDANYQEPSSSGSGDSGNTGGGSSTKTLAEKIAAKEQLTNVPTIYITVPDVTNVETDLVKTGDSDKDYHAATIQVVDKTEGGLTEFTDDVQIKVRGNSTAKEAKKPYRLKFAKDEKDAAGNVTVKHKHDLLGKGYAKRNWALLANFIDPAMVRNALTYKVGELVDMPFKPGYKFADVVINGEYRGTYQITDHVEVGTNRIDIDEDTGWFLESARGDMVESPSVSAQSLIMSIKNPEPATDAEIAALKTQIENWFKPVDALFCIYNGTFDLAAFTNPATGWRKYWDEESLVNFYLGINITGDYDGFMTVKMYRDVNGKMKFGPIWDKDLAYGNWSADDGKKLAEDQQSGSYFSSYVKKLWLDPVFVKKVHDKMAALVAGGLSTTLEDYVDALVAETAQTDALDHTKWSTSYSSWTLSFSSREGAVAQLKDYLAPHITWLKNTIDTQYEALGGDAIVDNTTGGDSGEGGESGGGAADHTEPHEFTLGEWQNVLLPSDTFHPNATKATFTVTGASYIRLLNSDDEYDIVSGYNYSWNTANQAGVTFDISGDVLTKAKAGQLYIRTGGGTNITLSITCTIPEGSGEGGGDTPTPTTRQQLTNLPTIYLDATEIGSEWKTATIEVYDSDNKLYQGTEWTSTLEGVQYQGSGAGSSKNSYRLKFGSKTKLLASGKYKQWVLASNDDDPSLMRNALAKELGDGLGLPFTPGYQFVDLYVNDVYMGTYQVTDRIKAEDGRALVSGGNKDSDWHVRFNDLGEIQEDGLQPSEYIAGTTAAPYIIPKNPDPDDLTADALTTLKSDMTNYFQNTVFVKDNDGHYTGIEDNVDKQQLIAWYIAQEVLGVYKGFSSIEAYRSVTATDQKLHLGVIWDSEKSLGNPGEATAINMTDLSTDGSYLGLMTNYAAYDVMKNVFTDLWTQAWFANGVNTMWTEKKETLLSSLNTLAASLSETLEQSQAKNLEKWTASLTSGQTTFNTYADAVASISTYLEQRFPYLTAKFSALAAELPCENHTYANGEYIQIADKTYRRACDNCGAAEEGDDATVYYKFDVYAQTKDAVSTITDNENWPSTQDVTSKPNTLFYTDAAGITGTNVISNGICENFVLTDGNKLAIPTKFSARNATYVRNISAGTQCGTICVPFKIVDNDEVELFALTKVTVNGTTGTMTFSSATKTGGSTPLAFRKVNKEATSITFTAGKQDNGLITVKATDGMSKNTASEIADGWTFYGNVTKAQEVKAADDPNIYYISGDKFWHATGKVTINPFRAYFSGPSTATGVKSFGIGIEECEETSISNVNAADNLAVFANNGSVSLVASSNMNVTICTASGIVLRKMSLEAEKMYDIALPAGMYIINNNKIAVK